MHIIGLCGSLRAGSYNRGLLAAALSFLPEGAILEVFERLADVPPYNEEHDSGSDRAVHATPVVVQQLREAICAADAVLIATPEYNASVPGHLKNVLDWASSPFPNNVLRDKPVAVLGTSTGQFGAAWAHAELRRILEAIGARVVDVELSVPYADKRFTGDGRLKDHRISSGLEEAVRALLQASSPEISMNQCA